MVILVKATFTRLIKNEHEIQGYSYAKFYQIGERGFFSPIYRVKYRSTLNGLKKGQCRYFHRENKPIVTIRAFP